MAPTPVSAIPHTFSCTIEEHRRVDTLRYLDIYWALQIDDPDRPAESGRDTRVTPVVCGSAVDEG